MRRGMFWLLLGILLVFLAVVVSLGWWLRGDGMRLRMAHEVSTALGVTVKVDRLDLVVYPLPALELTAVELQTRPPLTLGRVELSASS